MIHIIQKLYCYVDETGQDKGSDFFIVVAVVSEKEQALLRDQLNLFVGRRSLIVEHLRRSLARGPSVDKGFSSYAL